MNLFITQRSYYFVLRNFINIFEQNKSTIIYVQESGRGIIKKIFEMIYYIGIFNFILCFLNEIYYFIVLHNRERKLYTLSLKDNELNSSLEVLFERNKFENIISIGCPCKINSNFQKKFNIKIVNLHGGIIPYQKGRFSSLKSLRKRHKYLGSTIHMISDKFDEGKILSQNYFKIKRYNRLTNYNNVIHYSRLLLNKFLENKYEKIPKKIINDFK